MRTTRHGFTLIELLVVMAVISLMVALLLPVLSTARERAQQVRCASGVRQITTMVTLYDMDYKELPRGRPERPHFIAGKTHVTLRDDYGMSESLVTCPSSPPFTDSYNPWKGNDVEGRTTYNYFAGYGYSGNGHPETNNWIRTNFPARGEGFYPPRRIREVERPWRMPYLFDLAYMYQTVTPGSHKPNASNHGNGNSADAMGENVAFIDGHVEWHAFVPMQSWRYHNRGQWTWWTPSFTIASPQLHTP